MGNPITPEPGSKRPAPALLRLVRYTDTWLIAYHPQGFWSADRTEGSATRYLCGADMDELADRIDQAEAGS